MTETAIRSMGAAITLQAVRDYFACPKKQEAILKDLRSPYMDMLTNGQSIVVAEQLVKNPADIKARLRKHHKYGA